MSTVRISTSRTLAWSIWLIVSVFYAYQYILRVMPNVMLTEIRQQFNFDAAVFGQFSGAYYIGYCLMHLPIGIMLDRFGPRKVITGCILLTAMGLLPIVFTEHRIYPIAGRILIGIGSSAAILGAFKMIRMIFNEEHFTRMLSFTVTIGLVGAIYGGVPVGYLCDSYGHKTVAGLFAFMGIIFAGITYFIIPDMKTSHETTVLSDIKTVFTNGKVVLICFLAGLMVGPMEGFADAWGAAFLKQVYGFESKTANYLTSMIYIGMCFAPILSRIAEKSGYYSGTIAGAGIVMFGVFAMLVTGMMTESTITVGMLIVGLCCAYQILAIYKASTYVPENVAGLTTAVANMIIMSFGYVFHSIIGILIKIFSETGNSTSFIYGIAVIPITLILGTVGFLTVSYRERRSFGKVSIESSA